ncbi:MAG: YjzD family protein, partial [Staphylococcus epidermidis]|nr:YjzD family protein [Staphylococcus epidermidis]MDU3556169.1 YjzD family protein [Staphylococcus epidermidis]
MRYLMTFIWAVLLLQMVNFVLNSLNSGPELNVINPIIIAVIFTIVVAILDPILKPS